MENFGSAPLVWLAKWDISRSTLKARNASAATQAAWRPSLPRQTSVEPRFDFVTVEACHEQRLHGRRYGARGKRRRRLFVDDDRTNWEIYWHRSRQRYQS